MPEIKIPQKNRSIIFESVVNLMKILLENGIPVASSCRGDAVCGKCWVRVSKGAENLNSPNFDEQQLKEKYNLLEDQRISCQAQVFGDIQIETPYW